MTADDKSSIWHLLNTAEDAVRTGYRMERPVRDFADDATPPQPAPPRAGAAAAAESLETLDAEIRSCGGCALARERTQAVPGAGAAKPRVLVVGDAPGAEDEQAGRPFAGAPGELLGRMLASIGLDRERDCWLTQLVKCRPAEGRAPAQTEAAACRTFLDRQIDALKPAVLLCVGEEAARTLLASDEELAVLRGAFSEYRGIPLLPTYSPGALLADGALKRPVWEDLKALKAYLENC